VLAALLERARTGKGQLVEVAMALAALDLQQENIGYALNGFPVTRGPRHVATGYNPAPYGIYETKDGYIVLSMTPVAQVNAVLQLEALKPYEDPDARFPQRREISQILEPVIKTRTTQEWLDLLRAHDIWAAPVNGYEQVFADPAVQYLEPFVEVEHPAAGRVKLLTHPIRYEAGRPELRRPPPRLGEHTEEVLSELGYDGEQIVALRQSRAI
jgi:crotonobetainyl-CoA:carnitine CoA-transferase CaiB-like acyl-CoA transferase